MNAQTLLQSYGWLGPGHPLHPRAYKQKGHRGLAYDPSSCSTLANANGIGVGFSEPSASHSSGGLVKPLLVTHKQGRLGVGKKAHEPQQGNEWWLKGFERALGEVGKSVEERSSVSGSGVSTPKSTGAGGEVGGLYSFFVRGEEIQGTIGEEKEKEKEKAGRKRKSDVLEGGGRGGEKEKQEKEFAAVADFMAVRDKDEKRRRRKDEKNSVEEEFKAIGAFVQAREEKALRKKRKSENENAKEEAHDSPLGGQVRRNKNVEKSELLQSPPTPPVKTKEERREQRRRRREAKQSQILVPATSNEHSAEEGDAAVQEALRKAEKKRRKAQKASGFSS